MHMRTTGPQLYILCVCVCVCVGGGGGGGGGILSGKLWNLCQYPINPHAWF